MSTRANVIIKDDNTELYFYRHSDGYPKETGESLKRFVQGYKSGQYRHNASQSAGWLIIHGYKEYDTESIKKPSYDSWKVGAYEPTDKLHGDVEYVYVINLATEMLECYEPTGASFWDDPNLTKTRICTDFIPYSFKGKL